MPIKKSAKKALRQTEKRTKVNKDRKSNIKDLEKKLVKEISAKNKKEAAKALSDFSQALDKAVKNHVLLKNTASRQKSRLQKAVNKIS
ncbi:MAG: 30S ribosomal protein S20 [Patescibacteria group bacterium]